MATEPTSPVIVIGTRIDPDLVEILDELVLIEQELGNRDATRSSYLRSIIESELKDRGRILQYFKSKKSPVR